MSDPLEEARRSLEKLLPLMEAKHAELRGQDTAADAKIAENLRQTKATLSQLRGSSGTGVVSAWVVFIVLAVLGVLGCVILLLVL